VKTSHVFTHLRVHLYGGGHKRDGSVRTHCAAGQSRQEARVGAFEGLSDAHMHIRWLQPNSQAVGEH
jgi:hypothetical protein